MGGAYSGVESGLNMVSCGWAYEGVSGLAGKERE